MAKPNDPITWGQLGELVKSVGDQRALELITVLRDRNAAASMILTAEVEIMSDLLTRIGQELASG